MTDDPPATQDSTCSCLPPHVAELARKVASVPKNLQPAPRDSGAAASLDTVRSPNRVRERHDKSPGARGISGPGAHPLRLLAGRVHARTPVRTNYPSPAAALASGLQVQNGAQRLVHAGHGGGVDLAEKFRAVEPGGPELLAAGAALRRRSATSPASVCA